MPRVTLSCLTLGLAGAWLTRDPTAGLAMAAGGQLALGAAGGMAGDLCKAFDRHVAERWFAKRRATDENHVVEQALRKAHLHALRKTLERFDEARRDDRDEARAAEADGFSRRLAGFLDSEDTVARRLAFAKASPDDLDAAVRADALATLPEGYARSLAARQVGDGQDDIRNAQRHARRLSEAAALAELRHRVLREGDGFPPLFRSAFTGEGFAQSWFDIFVLDAAATQKSGGAFAEVWQAEVSALSLSILEALSETTARIAASTERTEAKVDTLPDAIVTRLLAELDARGGSKAAGEVGVERKAVIALAKRVRAEVDDYDQAFRELERAVATAIEVAEAGQRPSNLGDFVDQVLKRVAEKSASGAFDAAAEEIDAGFADWEEAHAASLAAGLKLLDAGLKQDILRRNPAAAAERVARMAALEHPGRAERFAALRAAQDEWYVRGRDKGLNFDLEVAIEIARLSHLQASDADDRGEAQNDLGIALASLGERKSDTTQLEQAVVAFRAALEEWTRERVPLDWAMTQNNLGNALLTLGERERGTARLEEAVAAYRAALEEYTRERVPLDWAMTQSNLGNALRALGERESGTGRLEEAVAAHRAALDERTRERVPLDWATTQNNLGIALQTLGERESGAGRLEEAVAAYRAALEEWTRERVPLDWATTQNNLGIALKTLGERESGTGRLEEAIKACRAALEERSRKRVPLDWAMTQNNLGNALRVLGERESDTARLEEAIAAYHAALEELTVANAPHYHAIASRNLRSAEALLAERRKG